MKSGGVKIAHASESAAGKRRADQGFLSVKLRGWTTDLRKKFAPWIKLYKKINGFGYSVLRNPLVPANTSQILAWTLYLRALSSYQAALLLAERGLDAECKTVLRSLAEAAFALGAIEKDQRFAARLLKSNEYEELQWMKKWNQVNRGQDKALQDKIAFLAARVSKKHKLGVRQIADSAGMLNVYHVQYSRLCMFGHPTPHSLALRMRRDEQTQMIETNLHPTANQAHDNLRLGMMFQIFAIKSFFNICQFPNPKRLIDLHDQFSDLISTLPIFDLKTSAMLKQRGSLTIVKHGDVSRPRDEAVD